MLKRVSAKIGAMRKEQSFIVSPMSDGRLMIQSDKAIGAFDPHTRKGVLNIKGCYFPHLTKVMGAVEYTFPESFVAECVSAAPAAGGETNLGGITIVNTVKVIGV